MKKQGHSTAVRSSYSRISRWTVAAKVAGGSNGGGEAMGTAKQRWPQSEGR
jgi:hypothetical protein